MQTWGYILGILVYSSSSMSEQTYVEEATCNQQMRGARSFKSLFRTQEALQGIIILIQGASKKDMSSRSCNHCPSHVLSLLCTLKDVLIMLFMFQYGKKDHTPHICVEMNTLLGLQLWKGESCFAHLSFKSVTIFLNITLSLCFQSQPVTYLCTQGVYMYSHSQFYLCSCV